MEEYRDFDNKPSWCELALWLMALLILLGWLTGCTTTKYVTVPEYHTQYVVKSDTILQHDSIILHDSIYIYHNGDTVIINKVAYRDKVRNVYKTVTDTVIKRDSIDRPVYITKDSTKEEKSSSWWDGLVNACKAVLICLLLGITACYLEKWWKGK